jgi:hypothetical protein
LCFRIPSTCACPSLDDQPVSLSDADCAAFFSPLIGNNFHTISPQIPHVFPRENRYDEGHERSKLITVFGEK